MTYLLTFAVALFITGLWLLLRSDAPAYLGGTVRHELPPVVPMRHLSIPQPGMVRVDTIAFGTVHEDEGNPAIALPDHFDPRRGTCHAQIEDGATVEIYYYKADGHAAYLRFRPHRLRDFPPGTAVLFGPGTLWVAGTVGGGR